MLNELENTVLRLAGRQAVQNQKVANPEKIAESLGIDGNEKTGILKSPEDMKVLKNMVKRKVEDSIDDIIDETAGISNNKLYKKIILNYKIIPVCVSLPVRIELLGAYLVSQFCHALHGTH